MFQTFSGSSRRPRQVNLSGQNPNPFAANSWKPAGSGTEQTVANAEKERHRRQQERERLNASKRIQRVWRGHKTRKEVANSRRTAWDELDRDRDHSGDDNAGLLVQQSQLLLTFFSAKRGDDIARLINLASRVSSTGFELFVRRQAIQPQLIRLAHITLQALQVSLPQCPRNLLQFLVAIVGSCPVNFPAVSQAYYTFLSALLSTPTPDVPSLDRTVLLDAVLNPLKGFGLAQGGDVVLATYTTFALYFLTTPDLAVRLGGLDELAKVVDVHLLSAALVREFSSSSVEQTDQEKNLWLLAHFISLHRRQQKISQEPNFLRALSLQLPRSSVDILSRVDAQDPEAISESEDPDTAVHAVQAPLPIFIKEELLSLVNQASISNLLAKFNIDYASGSASGEEDASLLASYALTLLRIFPRRGDEIRMWLYLGSMSTSNGSQIPALKFFWQTMSLTSTFSLITADSKAALNLLRAQTQRQSTLPDVGRDREWRTILLFLELYTFVLRFTDDEEFLSGSVPNLGQASGPVSRIRESALRIEDVQRLTLFLKNLAFTTYYHADLLLDDGQNTGDNSIGAYFGTNTTLRFQAFEKSDTTRNLPSRPFAGIAGMKFDYVRTIVSGVMRMLYERDSRRRFLPKGHWLMTSRFEMEGFIPAVVMEEERQHRIREEGEDPDADNDRSEASREMEGLVGMARPRRAQQIEALRRQQQKAARQKVMAAVGPRLEVLQNMPFVIPFETRVQIFRQFVLLDQSRRRGGHVDPDEWRMSIIQQSHMVPRHDRISGQDILRRHHAKIRRDQIFDDAFAQFYELGDGLKEPIQITFVDQFDTVEAGIDGGGVTKEFLTSITNEAFRSNGEQNLFIANDQNLLYPNPAAVDERKALLAHAGLGDSEPDWRELFTDLVRRYEFLGRIVGKCLYEGILVDIGFAGFFLLKWATAGGVGYRANINDLRDLDESLYQGLLKLKNYPGNVEDFSLDFTITDKISIPGGGPTQTITRELLPNGTNIAVTNENRPLYVSYVARHRLQVQPFTQTQSFLRGLSEIINPSWLSMFNQSELQTLIGGDSSGIDVEDLRRNTQYGGVYQIGDDGEEHPTIKLFWKVMHAMDDTDRRKVLKYVTSTPRAPLLGFSQLNPRFSIRDSSGDEERLPSTSTCVNLLKLPRYKTEKTLRDKLTYAVNSGAGFDLS